MIAARALLLLALLLGAPAVAFAQTEGHSVLGYQGANGLWHAYDTTGAGIPVSGGSGGGGAVTLPTTPSIANGSGVVPTQGGIALSATNGAFTNILQGNAALATGNPIFTQITAGSAAIGTVTTTPTAGTYTIAGCTVGVSSASCIATSTVVNHVMIQNTSATANIACKWTTGTAVLNSSGSVQLGPGQSALWGPATSGVPSGAMNCIASAASTPLYAEYN